MDISNMVQRIIMGVIGAVIFVLIGVALGPTVISSVAYINATTLSGVPLADVIVLLGEYVPAFYYLALVLGALGAFWTVMKFTG